LLFTSVIQSQLKLFCSSIILSSSEDRIRIHSGVLWFSVDKLGSAYTSCLCSADLHLDSLCYPLHTELSNSVLCAQHSCEQLCAQTAWQFIIKTV